MPSALAEQLRNASLALARTELLARLCRMTAEFLQRPEPAVDPRLGFVALGFDSLRAVDFRSRLEALLGCELRSTLLFDQPDCERLCDYLLLVLRGGAPAAPAAAPAPAAGAIAIVGMGCRFPGDATDLDAYWRLLREGRSAIGDVPPGRWPVDELYDPDPAAPGRIYTTRGGFLPAIDEFDAAFFGISPVEANMLDPQHRLLLEVAWATLEHAGLPAQRLQEFAPGVFLGMRASEYFQSQCARLPADADAWYATGNAISTAAGRLSYFFGFRGPCFALDTACSGSLVAVHQAVRSLRAGECRAALAGGVNALIDPLSSVGLCRARMLAPDGRCKTFDAAADGYVRSEGCGLVLLLPLELARELGVRVHAILRGSAINQDGRTGGLTVPHGPSQEAVVRAALADAGLSPDDVDYVEAHGTGTSLGDPIEVQALDRVFAGRRARGARLPIGSVKTNVGHLESAAGVSGLLKVVLALQHEQLPAHLHFERPNPHIDWQQTEVDVVTGPRAWPRGARPRRAGVSSFGFSGTNAHLLVEEGDPPAAATATTTATTAGRCGPASAAVRAPQLVVLSAPTASGLRALARSWATVIARDDAPTLADIAFTSAAGRAQFAHRVCVVTDRRDELAAALAAFAAGAGGSAHAGVAARTPPRLLFLFSGQGAQRAGAGRELYEHDPVFLAAIDRCAAVFDRQRDRSLREVLFGGDAHLLLRTDYTQPALFALQFALAESWRALGIVPSAVLGHSVGEIAAATAAGALSPEDGLRLCLQRGALMVRHCRPGAMLAVFAAAERVGALLGELPADCAVAAVNGPAETVLSGGEAAIEPLAAKLAAAGLRTQRLAVSHAFHSPLMAPMLAPFERFLARLPHEPPRVPFWSCRTAAAGAPDAAHWLRHVREPVRFGEALAAAAASADVLVEIGPTPVLLGLAARALPAPLPAVATLRPGRPERAAFLRAVGELWVAGAPAALAAGAADGDAPRRAVLPGYPFERQRFWLRRSSDAPRTALHPLLGAEVAALNLQAGQQLYEAALTEDTTPWIAQHRVHGRALMPGAAIVECALAAASRAFATSRLELRDLAIQAPLWLGRDAVTMQLLLEKTGDDSDHDGATFRWCRREGSHWPVHAVGRCAPCGPAPTPAAPPAAPQPRDPAAFYAAYAAAGLEYGPLFRAVRTLACGDRCASGAIALPASIGDGDLGEYIVHPVLLDACLQIAGAAAAVGEGNTWLPVGIGRLQVHGRLGRTGTCHARCRDAGERTRTLDVQVLDADGALSLVVEGLQLLAADAATLAPASGAGLLHSIHWDRRPRAGGRAVDGMFVVAAPAAAAEAKALADSLASALAATGATAATSRLGTPRTGLATVVVDARTVGDLDADGLADLLAAFAEQARGCAAARPAQRLCVLTAGSVAADVLDTLPSPAGAALLGAARALALEHPELQVRAIDVDARTGASEIAAELRQHDGEDQVALRGDLRLLPRLQQGLAGPGDLALPDGPFRLRCREYGRLDRIAALPVATPPAPGPGALAIDVGACGLNFKDVLHALGLLRQWSEARGIRSAPEQPLGFECAGTVVAVGPGVHGFAVGDAVLACAEDAMQSRVVAPAARAIRLPAGVDLAAAAGLPTVFATALYALRHLAKLQPGERVLVHAAAGGVGLAALQVCRRAGCTVFATSSPGKAAFLRAQGVAGWADSRGSDFSALRAASGGVDVVLNCLGGEAIAQSLDLLRPGGRFVEIGKRGIWSPEQMAARRPDVRYHAFDLAELAEGVPGLLPDLLGELQRGLADGSLQPVVTARVPMQRAPAAFAAMAQALHVGKIVLTLARPQPIRGDRTYVLTGGTGAVGRAFAAALVGRGARHLALIARTEPPTALLDDLRAHADVRVYTADVADRAALAGALDAVRRELPMVAGAVHAAGVLHDQLLPELDVATLRAVLRPKVDGLRNLQALLPALDFLGATGSMAAWLGNAGQIAYAAANAWLDAWCRSLRAQGTPACAIAFGPFADAGMAARMTPRERARLRERGIGMMPLASGTALGLACLQQHEPGPGVLPVRWNQFARQRGGAVPSLLRGLVAAPAAIGPAATGSVAAGELGSALAALPADERRTRLRAHLRGLLAQVLGFAAPEQIDDGRTFGELGIDSLLAVELRTRLATALGLSLPATLLFDQPDLDRLARHLTDALGAPTTASPAPDGDGLAAALAAQVRAMEARP